MATNTLETLSGWEFRDQGPGVWASDEHDEVSIWIEDGCMHIEGKDDCDVPLNVIVRLIELRTHDANCTCGASKLYPGAVMGHGNQCEVGRFWRNR